MELLPSLTDLIPLALLFLLFLFALIVYHSWKAEKKTRLWRDAAEKFGFEFGTSFFTGLIHIKGREHELEFKISKAEIQEDKHGHHIVHRNIIEVPFTEPTWKTVKIVHYEALEELAIAFGGADLKTGNPEFDKVFRIAGSPEDSVMKTLRSPSIATLLLDLNNCYDQFYINRGTLYLRLEQKVQTTEQIKKIIDDATTTVAVLQKALSTSPFDSAFSDPDLFP